MPKESMIIGRYLGLADSEKSRIKRIAAVSEEIEHLWNFLNFPVLSSRSVARKIETVLKKYDAYLKRPVGNIHEYFSSLFDVTNKTGQWLCAEDKKLYEIQIQSGGTTGYATAKIASKSTIHPSKRRKFCKVNDALEQQQSGNFQESSSDSERSQISSDDTETDEAEIIQSSTSESPDQGTHLKRSQQSTSSAVC